MDMNEIAQVIDLYLEGLNSGDTGKLRAAFHPAAHLHSAPDGTFASLSLDEWCRLVESRPSPASQGFGREHERVLQIAVTAPGCANATLICAAPGRRFTDHLTLLRVEADWQIVHKSFHAATAA